MRGNQLKADVVELVDTLDLGSSAARCAGSIPVIRTKPGRAKVFPGFFISDRILVFLHRKIS